MVNYKEILRLLHEGYSQREIERSLHTSRRKIREFLDAASQHNITCPLEEAVTNEQLEAILFPERYALASTYLEPDYTWIHSELAQRGVTLTLLWDEYRRKAESVSRKPYMMTRIRRRQSRRQVPRMGTHHQGNDAYPP